MKIFKASILLFITMLIVISGSECRADIKSVLYSSNIQVRSLTDNIFFSRYSFSAYGFIITDQESEYKKYIQTNYKGSPDKIIVNINNNVLDKCSFMTLDTQMLTRMLNSDIHNSFVISGWTVNCQIPLSFESGTYTAKIDITLDDGTETTIIKDNIEYNIYIKFITARQTLIAIFFIIMILFLELPSILYKVLAFITPVLLYISYITKNVYIFYGYLFWMLILIILYYVRPSSIIHQVIFRKITVKHSIFLFLYLIVLCSIYTIPMNLSPFHTAPLTYNGKIFSTNEQYAALAQQIMQGKLYIDYGEIDKKLLDMENPYDYSKRIQNNVEYPLDHSFYNGKFYMYFGVVPVFVIFIPYQLITGEPLASYYATKVFVIFSIIGIFSLFYLFTYTLFNRITFSMYLMLSTAFALISTWCCVDAPTLYCTAVSSGICFEIWSIYFFARSLLSATSTRQKIINILIGAFFGALVFGCRPPIALSNIIFIPVLFYFIKYNTVKRIKYTLLLVSPYFIIISLLMLYNYLRFDNPFEFGLSYLLTIEDLHIYKNYIQDKLNINIILLKLFNYLFEINSYRDSFPFVTFNGIFINFPILLSLFILINKKYFCYFYKHNICLFLFVLLITPFVIGSFNSIMVNNIIERYRMDIYFVVAVSSFLAIGAYYMSSSLPQRVSFFFTFAAFTTILYNILLIFVPQQGNFTYFFPEINHKFFNIITFGLGGTY